MKNSDAWPSARYKPQAGSIPHAPGVYRFRSEDGTVLYVGKAKHLDTRLPNYFGDPDKLHPRTKSMLEAASGVSWMVCASESEALVLEQSWIHQYRPRFNVAMKNSDTKYPSLAISVNEEVPRIMPWRGPRKKGLRYFGPYPSVSSRDLLDALLRVFPMRSCPVNVFNAAAKSGRPCLLGDIGKCAAPCVGRVSKEEHLLIVKEAELFLGGQHDTALTKVREEMNEAAEALDFEKAARRRDEAKALESTFERQKAVGAARLNADAVAVMQSAGSERLGVAQIIVRNGNITGARTWNSERDPLLSSQEQLDQVLGEIYATSQDFPEWLLLEELTPGCDALVELFKNKSKTLKVVTPKAGPKLDILAAAVRNAEAALQGGALKRSEQLEDREAALEAIGEVAGAGVIPWRIECMDIAHISGTLPVASVVVFEDAKPNTNQYRRLNLPEGLNADDVESIRQGVLKRFGGTQAGMSRRPDLFIVDGGPSQVQAALEAFQELGITDVALCGLAKRLEEIWLPLEDQPVILSRNSPALLLLQFIRDEAHRVANTGHRKRRERAMLVSALDGIKGLGESKRKALMSAFGTVGAIANASVIDLQGVDGIGPQLAAKIKEALN